MAIAAEKIDEIRERADAVRLIGEKVALKKQGKNFVGLCPFHAEDTPSFSVQPDRGLFYCFGCHAGGDIFSFFMRHEGKSFAEAVRYVADSVGVALEPESPAQAKRRAEEEGILKANSMAQAFFAHHLWGSAGVEARRYLKQRQIPEAFARAWGLGFGGGDGELIRYLGAKGVTPQVASAAGILTEDGRKCLFDGRLTFAIGDLRGRLAGFGGRRLHEEGGPKYINSRESLLFSKRTLLYGWHKAENAIRRGREVVLVEGYMDVLACHRAGVEHVVAALGTAFSPEHARACARLSERAVLLFDGDRAGIKASFDATEKLLGTGKKTSVAPLPAGEDPDSLLRKGGADALKTLIASAKPALEYFLESRIDPNADIEDRSKAAEALAPLLWALKSGLERDLYTARMAERVGVSTDQLHAHFKRLARAQKPAQAPKTNRPPRAIGGPVETVATKTYRPALEGTAPPLGPQLSEHLAAPAEGHVAAPRKIPPPQDFELKALAELLIYPSLRARFGDLAEYTGDAMRTLLDEIADSEEDIAAILPRHIQHRGWLGRLVGIEPPSFESAEDEMARAERTFNTVLNRFKEKLVHAMWEDVVRQIIEAEAKGEDTEELLARSRRLKQKKMELKGSLASS